MQCQSNVSVKRGTQVTCIQLLSQPHADANSSFLKVGKPKQKRNNHINGYGKQYTSKSMQVLHDALDYEWYKAD